MSTANGAAIRRNRRARLFGGLALAMLVIGGSLRLALSLREGLANTPLELLRVLLRGVAYDAAVVVVLLAPFAAFASFRQTRATASGLRLRRPALLLGLWTFAFLAVVEYYFFEEFDARFNHLVIDYVLFPGEVAGNIWETYSVPVVVLLTGAVAAGLTWAIERGLRRTHSPQRSGRRRVLEGGAALLLGALALAALVFVPAPRSGNRQLDELASNDLVSLAHAVETASLDYESYYRTVPKSELPGYAQRELGWKNLAAPEREFRAFERREQPLDVVVILGESFGSQFVGRLGGDMPCAPGLERWAQDGLLLTNLMATGNRTVRGLEGVLCSFVPLPGDSIWKRDKSSGLATIASVLREHDYRTEFLYGGDGAFDGMRSFALDNGWERFFEDALVGSSSYPPEAFRTIWGVSDEFLFDQLLARQRTAAADGVRFFGTALTVSNHKPYLTPDTADLSLRAEKLAVVGRWGGALLVVSALALGFLRKRWGAWRLTSGLLAAWSVFALLAWTSVQPRDNRESAVRYADRALAEYLDTARAEGLLDHTVVLFVGDHGARVYGSEQIPAASYRVPALFIAPEADYHNRTIDRLCSQVDLAPTLLSLAGVDYRAPFFGSDLLSPPEGGPGRAWLIHNRDVGLLTDQTLTVLGLQGEVTYYRRPGRESNTFEPITGTPALGAGADGGAAVFQIASALYEQGRYRLPDAH